MNNHPQPKRLLKGACLFAAALVGCLSAQAATHNVISDPALTWNGYVNIFTNGTVDTVWPPYMGNYLGPGTWFDNQSRIDESGTVRIAPDIRTDLMYPYDPLLWQDDQGTSPGICKVVSTFYTDDTSFAAGDKVIFTGTLETNGLAAPYKDSAVAFIKSFDASWNYRGMVSVNLNTFTNGQAFAVTLPAVAGNGDHVQWGLEWAGPPARVATVDTLGFALVSTNGTVTPPQTTNVNVYIDPSQNWAGYESLSYQDGSFWRGDYLGADGATLVQGSISSAGTVVCAPDIRMDTFFHEDLSAWMDASGTSEGICKVTSTFYVDRTDVAKAGDTVIFKGTLVTNGLAEPYASSIVAFIKDFSPSWGWNGMTTINLNTLTNGETFSVSKVIAGNGHHVQWGFEWSGPPARTNTVASLGTCVLSSNSVAPVGPQILSINPASTRVLANANVTFTATATGSGLSYQWRKDGINLANGPGISGATGSALALTAVAPSQEGRYSLVVTDSANRKATNSASLVVFNPGWLYFDRALAPFDGWINAFDITNTVPPPSGSTGTKIPAITGFGVNPTSLLRANVNLENDTITLQPNTYVFDNAIANNDPFWIKPDGSANKYLEQDFFISADLLSGQTLTFAGFCTSNSLNSAYTAVAWIKDMNADWSLERRYDAPLQAGKPFSITVPTIAGNHIQYGFGLFGPANASTNSLTSGAVEIRPYSPLSFSHSGGNLILMFPTLINHSYSVLYSTDLQGGWTTLNTLKGNGSSVTVTDTIGPDRRFYRLSIQ